MLPSRFFCLLLSLLGLLLGCSGMAPPASAPHLERRLRPEEIVDRFLRLVDGNALTPEELEALVDIRAFERLLPGDERDRTEPEAARERIRAALVLLLRDEGAMRTMLTQGGWVMGGVQVRGVHARVEVLQQLSTGTTRQEVLLELVQGRWRISGFQGVTRGPEEDRSAPEESH